MNNTLVGSEIVRRLSASLSTDRRDSASIAHSAGLTYALNQGTLIADNDLLWSKFDIGNPGIAQHPRHTEV